MTSSNKHRALIRAGLIPVRGWILPGHKDTWDKMQTFANTAIIDAMTTIRAKPGRPPKARGK